MAYDVAFRHQQALDPSSLSTIEASLHAIGNAIADCRTAGRTAETDPAVILLARHLGDVADGNGPQSLQLRRYCMDEIANLKRTPTLITLAARGVDHDEQAKAMFHAEGRRAMQRLADTLLLDKGTYDIRSNKGGIAVSGEITLHTDEAYVQLSLGFLGEGHEVMFRRVRGRHDFSGDWNRWASVQELLAPDDFAARLRRELKMTEPTVARTRLFA